MSDAIYIFVIMFTVAMCLYGIFRKPITKAPEKKKYEGVKDLAAWHKNVSTRWE